MMKAVVVKSFGEPDVLRVLQQPQISVKNEHDVCIRVHAIGVNPVDTYIRAGQFLTQPDLPYTPGFDAAGVVESVGPGVGKFRKGDRVYTTSTISGAYAEYTVAEDDCIGHLPENLTFEQGAAVGIPYFTAYRALFMKANAKKGDVVLIHGASGGVGLAAVQIAKAYGMQVVGTAGSEEGLEVVRKTGADLAVNHHSKGYTDKIIQFVKPNKGGVDIILEMLANQNLVKDMELLDRHGRVVVIGCRGHVKIDPRMLMEKETSITAVAVLTSSREEMAITREALYTGMKDCWLVPVIGKIYPLEKSDEAHREIIDCKGTRGKMIIVPK